MYGAVEKSAWLTPFAEFFQLSDYIDRRTDAPYFTVFTLQRTVSLLRTDQLWPINAGGNMALNSGPRHIAQAYSRQVYAEYAAVEGIYYPSSQTNQPAVAFFERARGAIPPSPNLDRALTDSRLKDFIENAARRIGRRIIP